MLRKEYVTAKKITFSPSTPSDGAVPERWNFTLFYLNVKMQNMENNAINKRVYTLIPSDRLVKGEDAYVKFVIKAKVRLASGEEKIDDYECVVSPEDVLVSADGGIYVAKKVLRWGVLYSLDPNSRYNAKVRVLRQD